MTSGCLDQECMSPRLDHWGVLQNVMSYEGMQTASDHNSDPTNPIVRAIVFSRYFVPTYYVCLTIIIVVASLVRLRDRSHQKLLHQHVRSSDGISTDTWSAASTICGPESPSIKGKTHSEWAPLLERGVENQRDNYFISRVSSHLKAFLLYQPRPIPALTAPLNRPPSNGTTSVILLLLGINLFYLLYKNIPSVSRAQPFADRAGLCFVANLPILYILGAKNNRPLKWVTGSSYEGLNIVHRRIGEWMVVLACLHAAGMVTLWYHLFRPLGHNFMYFISIKIIAIGISTLATILAIYVTSSGYFRQWCYELFLIAHIVLQVAVLILLFFHHRTARPYCIAAMVIWILDRLVTRVFVSRRNFVATLQIAPDGETVLLFCDIPLTPHKHGGIASGWQAGQHIFIGVPEMGWKYRYQLHPFTIASPAPPPYLTSGEWPLQLIIRSKAGFSLDLLQFAEHHQHARVVVDGPYGGTDMLESLRSSERTCLIAGGTGISVTYPLSWALQATTTRHSIISTRTIYQNGVRHTPRLNSSATLLNQQRHYHLWLRQHSSHAYWVTMLPRCDAVLGSDRTSSEYETSNIASNLVNKVYNTRNVQKGRPDIQFELREWIHNDPNTTTLDKDRRICIVVSGPDDLAREVRNCTAALVREGYNIELFVEKFGW